MCSRLELASKRAQPSQYLDTFLAGICIRLVYYGFGKFICALAYLFSLALPLPNHIPVVTLFPVQSGAAKVLLGFDDDG